MFPRKVTSTAAYLYIVSRDYTSFVPRTYAAVPIKISCTRASVMVATAVEKATTNPNTSHAMGSRFIGTRNSKITGMRSIPTARDTEMALTIMAIRPLA
jgi:hypothetical protein